MVSVFLGIIFGISMLFLIIFYGKRNAQSNSYAEIYQNGELIKTMSLEQDATLVIEGKQGAYNKIQIKDGRIGIVEASCPDFLCGRMGFLSHGPIPIICLPNELVIEIHTGENDWKNGTNPVWEEESNRDEIEEIDGVVY